MLTQSAPVIPTVHEPEPAPVVKAPELPPKPVVAAAPVAEPQEAVTTPKAVPAAAATGPTGEVAPGAAARKKVGKLNNQWAAKEAEAAEVSHSPQRPSGPKKIVVKAKRGPSFTQLPTEGSSSADAASSSLRQPPIPPPEAAVSPRRNSMHVTASEPATAVAAAEKARPVAQTMRMAEAPKVVSQETLEELTKMNDRRTNIVREMFETEKTYVRNLKEICDAYLTPMKDTKWRESIPKLFSNVQPIVTINEELLGGLAELIGSWDTTKSLVGPIFQKMAPFMRLYNTYGNSYNEAIGLLSKLKEKDDFVQFLTNCRGNQPLDLEALLIQPVQRIPRYRMLLEDLLKNTPSAHPDRDNMESSLKHIRDVATNVNESIRMTEQSKKIAEQTGLQKYIAPHRKLLQEGFFSAKVSVIGGEAVKGAIEVALYLFNDLLVMFFAKAVKLKDARRHDFVELAWPSALMWVSLDGKTAFKIVGPSFAIQFSSKEKDATTGMSQVAGFHQRVVEVCSAELPEGANAVAKPTNPTPGTHFGSFEFPEGMMYVGEWKNGLPHGKGTQTFAGGLRVEGTFEEGLKHGECRIVFPTGEVYSGSCMKDDQHGPGQIVWPNGDCYNGYWLGGRRDGEGTFTCAHYKYTGSWSDGFMEGEGKLIFNGGGAYEGKFKEGKFHGEGRLVRCTGTRTKGTWVAGVQEGEGEELYPESMPFKSYQGTFRNDKREGSGTMFYRDGSQYKGDWKAGVRHGRGVLTCPSRPIMRYEGMWVDDKFEGKGEIFFCTKDRYVGSFSGGCMHGTGTYLYANGMQIFGEWRNGTRQRKLVLAGEKNDQKWEMELVASKERVELGEAKINGKLMPYFVPPARPDLDQCLLELEVVPDQENNLLTGTTNPRGSSASLPPAVTGPIPDVVDSPTLARAGDRSRTGSLYRPKK